MILELGINDETFRKTGEIFLDEWDKDENKVVILKSNKSGKDIKKFFENFCKSFGKTFKLAEDVTIGDRDNQRIDDIWMEVRFDP